MTTLGTRPVDEPNFLALIADGYTPLAKPLADAFRDACRTDADAHEGWVHPSRVSALLHESVGDFDPRRFSALWSPACGREGYLDKTDRLAPIDPAHSRGNGNKDVRLRRWRGWPDSGEPPVTPSPQRCPTCMGHGWTGSRHDSGPYGGHYHCPCGAPCAVDRAEGCRGAREKTGGES